MKNIIAILVCIVSLALISCEDLIGAGGMADTYFIYVDGDPGRSVVISYLESQPEAKSYKDNAIVSESVILPYFKAVNTYRSGGKTPDKFLQVQTLNDTTTRGVVFDYKLPILDGTCKVTTIFYPENAKGKYAHCKDISKDSVMDYLKSVNYHGYMEFAKGETVKKVRLYD
ncbi:MAG: hypothetical protein H6584_08470 [Flavobacteriales bacterium]|nr:hypothetical protein [Flavobacteriales bacterium]